MKNRVIWLAAILLIGFMGFGASHAAPGDNLLTNGGFETGDDTGWGGYGPHIRTVVQELVGADVAEGVIEGNNCLHVSVAEVGTNGWDAALQTYQGETFEAGKSYTLSAYFKSKSGPMQINFKPELAADPWTGYGDQLITITDEWAEYSVSTGVMAVDVNPASITFHIQYTAGEFWVDCVRFYEGDYVPPDIVPQKIATKPVPRNGEAVAPIVFETNVYLTLDYKPGDGAITHTGYFSDNEADVISRDAAHSLGNPPYPGVDPEMFYVGYDAPEVAVIARPPLEPGKTYYWAIDEFNGTQTYPGDVWSFTVMPEQAWGPDPFDGEGLVPTSGTFVWNLGDIDVGADTLSYNVYIGTDEAAVAGITTGDTASPLYAGNVSAESYDYADFDPQTEIFWRVDTKLTITRPPFSSAYTTGDVWSFTTAPSGTGNILREVWLNIGGGDITNLTDEPNYPGNPDISGLLPLFEAPSSFEPTGVDISYGQRLHGWLVVGQTGDYTFWTVADDTAELWLSTDMNPDNAVLVSRCTGWVNPRQFDDPKVIPSDPIHLEGGRQYYISGLMAEGTGGDNFSAAWQGPDNGGLRGVIPGRNLKPFLPVTAKNPDPASNSVDAAINVTLAWEAGTDESTGSPYATQHVYVGSDPVAVANATTASPEYMGNPTGTDQYGPLSLAYYEQVYWRIDGVSSGSGTVENPGFVWTFRTLINPAWASNPNPADGATDIDGNTSLSWTPGVGATAHSVYLGADDPANMVQVVGPQTATTYNPGLLDLGTTYYWRVVESPSMGEGATWQFTTAEYLALDDMESYTPWTTTGNNIFEAWRDGAGNCSAGNGNDTGSTLTENPSPVLGGIQSMKYDFDNDGLVYSVCTLTQVSRPYLYSKIEAQVATLPSGIGSNWTVRGVKALSVPFHGQLGNSTTDSLWVQLQDGSKGYGDKVFYGDYEGESLDDFGEETWHIWDIDLADFNVDLTNVVSIVIGIGTEGSAVPGGSGTLFFDEMRLYVPRCTPQRAKSVADFDDNCQVDYRDAAALFDNWLLRNIPETAWSGAWLSSDIGDVNVPGSFSNLGGGAFSITARGADIWDQADAFRYAYQPLSGDGQLTIRVTDIAGPSINDWRKAGVMVRETLDADSAHAFMSVTPAGGNGESFQWRPATGVASQSSNVSAGVAMPTCVRILRTGDTFRGFYYDAGEWIQEGSPVTIPMAEDVYIGLAVTSHEASLSSTVTFDRACPDEFVPMDLIEDDVINFNDYAELMSHWLETVHWPE